MFWRTFGDCFSKIVSTSILRPKEYLFCSKNSCFDLRIAVLIYLILFQRFLKLYSFNFTVFFVLQVWFLLIFPQIHWLSQTVFTLLLNPLKHFNFLRLCIPCWHLVLFLFLYSRYHHFNSSICFENICFQICFFSFHHLALIWASF